MMNMTGKQKVEAAFSAEGTSAVPAAIAYDTIFTRDHAKELYTRPWWHAYSPQTELRVARYVEPIASLGLDYFSSQDLLLTHQTAEFSIEIRSGQVYRINRLTGAAEEILEPKIGGDARHTQYPDLSVESTGEIDDLIFKERAAFDERLKYSGSSQEFSMNLVLEHPEFFPYFIVYSPFANLFSFFDFEEAMMMFVRSPDLVKHFCNKYLEITIEDLKRAKSYGAEAIQLDVAYGDMISHDAYKAFVVPTAIEAIEAARALGLKTVYNHLGNPAGKLKEIFSTGAECYKFEESKKGFVVEITEIASELKGKATLQGNLDAIGVLQNGSEEQLKNEIKRQIEAAKINKGRFIMCTGSPVTPATPVKRVQLYTDMIHEFGNI